MFRLLNALMSLYVQHMPLASWLFKFFARLVPVATYDVRGVKIRALLPLHQIGTFNGARRWSVREPETLDWLDSLAPNSVLFDIGSNFGTESLYAALKPGGPAHIIAFDIEYLASYNLAINLLINDVRNVDNYFLALGGHSGFIRVEENANYFKLPNQPQYARAWKYVPVTTVDQFVKSTGVVPTYIKMDVDGAESDIVHGMAETLADPRLLSVFIEINTQQMLEEIRATMVACGFQESERYWQGWNNYLFWRAPRAVAPGSTGGAASRPVEV